MVKPLDIEFDLFPRPADIENIQASVEALALLRRDCCLKIVDLAFQLIAGDCGLYLGARSRGAHVNIVAGANTGL